MKKKTASKVFMVAAGLLAAIVILFSQTYYRQAEPTSKKDSEEKAKSEKVIIPAPSDAVTSNTLVNLGENPILFTQHVFSASLPTVTKKVEGSLFVNFFTTLFRVIISPNAP